MSSFDITRIIQDHWPVQALRAIPLESGSPNNIWKIETASKDYVLKHCNYQVEPAWFDFQNDVIEDWGARKIPVVPALATLENRSYARVHNHIYQLREYIAGDRFTLNNSEQLKQAARLTVEIHRSDLKASDHKSTFNDLEKWLQEPELNLQLLTHEISQLDLSEQAKDEAIDLIQHAVSSSCQRLSFRDYIRLPQVCTHGELHHTNLIYQNDVLVGLIDYDSVQVRPRIYDIGRAALFLSRKGRGDFHVNPDFVHEFCRIYNDAYRLTHEEFEAIIDILRLYFVPTVSYLRLMKNTDQLGWYLPWILKGIRHIDEHFAEVIRATEKSLLKTPEVL